ncbi:energy transducer TonB [candidate division KSB1 bacterium]|nr:energy transducer TonB [candidate division KSB1 bacterium]
MKKIMLFWSLLVKLESKLNRDNRQFFTDTVDTTRLVKHKNPKADLKLQRKKVYELSLAITLALLIATFQLGSQHRPAPASIRQADIKIEVVDIPATRQYQKPPPPARPGVPIPSVEELIPEDLTIATTEIDFSDIPPPPAWSLDDDEAAIFVAYDKPPEVIGGFSEIRKHLKYPWIAKSVGIAGIVFVRVLVGVAGTIEKTEIIKAKPANLGFEEAAVEAIKQVRWEPAEQHDKKVRVWLTIPIRFSLARA